MKEVKVGPVNSTFPALDSELRDYLKGQGFAGDAQGVEWSKQFPDAIAADHAVQAVTQEIDRLAQKYGPVLPNIFQI